MSELLQQVESLREYKPTISSKTTELEKKIPPVVTSPNGDKSYPPAVLKVGEAQDVILL
jgi:hypothetical protein